MLAFIIQAVSSSNEKSSTQDGRPEDRDACPFCDEIRVRSAVASKGTVFAIKDLYPVTEGHVLLVPRRHTPDLFSMTKEERIDALELIDALREDAQKNDPSIVGFNVGANCGVAAGQTVMHAHIHLIPRRSGDTADPRGGVRGVIPGRMNYG